MSKLSGPSINTPLTQIYLPAVKEEQPCLVMRCLKGIFDLIASLFKKIFSCCAPSASNNDKKPLAHAEIKPIKAPSPKDLHKEEPKPQTKQKPIPSTPPPPRITEPPRSRPAPESKPVDPLDQHKYNPHLMLLSTWKDLVANPERWEEAANINIALMRRADKNPHRDEEARALLVFKNDEEKKAAHGGILLYTFLCQGLLPEHATSMTRDFLEQGANIEYVRNPVSLETLEKTLSDPLRHVHQNYHNVFAMLNDERERVLATKMAPTQPSFQSLADSFRTAQPATTQSFGAMPAAAADISTLTPEALLRFAPSHAAWASQQLEQERTSSPDPIVTKAETGPEWKNPADAISWSAGDWHNAITLHADQWGGTVRMKLPGQWAPTDHNVSDVLLTAFLETSVVTSEEKKQLLATMFASESRVQHYLVPEQGETLLGRAIHSKCVLNGELVEFLIKRPQFDKKKATPEDDFSQPEIPIEKAFSALTTAVETNNALLIDQKLKMIELLFENTMDITLNMGTVTGLFHTLLGMNAAQCGRCVKIVNCILQQRPGLCLGHDELEQLLYSAREIIKRSTESEELKGKVATLENLLESTLEFKFDRLLMQPCAEDLEFIATHPSLWKTAAKAFCKPMNKAELNATIENGSKALWGNIVFHNIIKELSDNLTWKDNAEQAIRALISEGTDVLAPFPGQKQTAYERLNTSMYRSFFEPILTLLESARSQ